MPSSFTYDTTADVRLTDIISNLLGWIKRSLIWLVLGTLAGAGIALLLNARQQKQYTSSFVGYANNMDDLRLRESLQHLNMLRVTGEVPELAKRLGLSEDEAKQVVNIIGLPNNTLESDLPPFPPREPKTYFFQVQATVTDPALFPKVQKGIVAYVDQNPTIHMLLTEQRASYQRRIAQDQAEIEYLQGAKKELLAGGRISVLDIGTISRHIVDINEKMEEAKLSLAKLEHEVVVTRPMEVVRKPSTPGPYRAGAFGAAIGLAATLMGLGMISLGKLAKSDKQA